MNFEFGQFLHTLKSLRVHFVLLQLAGAFSGNNTIQCKDKKRKMNVHCGYNLRSFQEWQTNLYSNGSVRSPLSE